MKHFPKEKRRKLAQILSFGFLYRLFCGTGEVPYKLITGQHWALTLSRPHWLNNGVKNEKLILRGCQETALGDEMFPGPCKGGSAQPMISTLCVREGREGRGHECCLWWDQSRTMAHLGHSWKGSLLPVAHLHRKLGFSDHEIYIPAPI